MATGFHSLHIDPHALNGLSPERIGAIRRGLEKESLRTHSDGHLALTPHPADLGSALTHPNITTDFSESQLELITGAHHGIETVLAELHEVHAHVQQVLGEDGMWASSMPCRLPTDETIPIARYGSSHIARAKSVYRVGLAHRYGRRMQTISGIHFNWSLPGLDDAAYFGLIRNFRRHVFLMLYLTGASPAVCRAFVEGRPHELVPVSAHSLHAPHGTSLRMGRLGYQSEAQASISVSYNGLDPYAASLHEALVRPWPAYEAIGVRGLGGEYNQLSTALLQIENEFYGMIRPKRTTGPGERPLQALYARGVEYVEVRMLDLDPFDPAGIGADTMRLLDVFLLHCLLAPSPFDTPDEIIEIKRNQHLTAARGREPGLELFRDGKPVLMVDWARALLNGMEPIAGKLDAINGGAEYARVLDQARNLLADPTRTPSARVLAAMARDHEGSVLRFSRAQSHAARAHWLAQPLSAEVRARFAELRTRSLEMQRAIEASDSESFEDFRIQYITATQALLSRQCGALPGTATGVV